MASLQFKPVCHSWVALHPKPKGVIQFIGGAFFGTFAPSLFYRHLLQFFFDQSYSIIIYPFSLSFNHCRESFFLLREQYRLAPALIEMAMAKGEDPIFYLESKSYIWLGHSIGCRCIALLEPADQLPEDPGQPRRFIAKLLELPLEQARNRIGVDAKFVSVDFTNIWPLLPSNLQMAAKASPFEYQPAGGTDSIYLVNARRS